MSNIKFHLTYDRSLTMGELSCVLIAVENLYKAAYKNVKRGKEGHDLPKEMPLPTIERVSEGSINIDLNLSEVVGAAAATLISIAIERIIKKIKEKKTNDLDRQSSFIISNSNFTVNNNYFSMDASSKALDACSTIGWDLRDEECFVIYTIREYVLFKNETSIHDFIDVLPDFLMRKYGFDSLKMKLENAKYIFEELNVDNTLKISSMSGRSVRQKKITIDELTKLKIL